MSSEHRQSNFEKYGCLACIKNKHDMPHNLKHDPECPEFKEDIAPGITVTPATRIAQHVQNVIKCINTMHKETNEARCIYDSTPPRDPSPAALEALAACDGITSELSRIQANAMAGGMPMSVEVSTFAQTETLRALLEIGCDLGIEACHARDADGYLGEITNPFRRASTTITEPTDAQRVQAITEQNARTRAEQSMPEDDAFPAGCGGQPSQRPGVKTCDYMISGTVRCDKTREEHTHETGHWFTYKKGS